MTKILIGTSNPSKTEKLKNTLQEYTAEFVTLADLNIQDEPEETGRTPEENARIKAEFYGKFCDIVICEDAGLYFEELSMDDPRQPGLHVRTPMGQARLDDEAMIAYYTGLIHELGGKVKAYYRRGWAIYNHGHAFSYLENKKDAQQSAFYMLDMASPLRREGWPLDSISVAIKTGHYFIEEASIAPAYRRDEQQVSFLREALGQPTDF